MKNKKKSCYTQPIIKWTNFIEDVVTSSGEVDMSKASGEELFDPAWVDFVPAWVD